MVRGVGSVIIVVVTVVIVVFIVAVEVGLSAEVRRRRKIDFNASSAAGEAVSPSKSRNAPSTSKTALNILAAAKRVDGRCDCSSCSSPSTTALERGWEMVAEESRSRIILLM